MAIVRLQHQQFEIPDELIALDPRIVAEKGEEEAKKQRESNLKRWLSQVSPAATNATLNWSEETKDGTTQTVIRVMPQLGTKGMIETLTRNLSEIPQTIHPAMSLTFELKMLQINGQLDLACLLAYQSRIADALEYESKDCRLISTLAHRLIEAKPAKSPWAPIGF